VPTVRNTSHEVASSAAATSSGDSDSPNHTTAGRARPPQCGHRGGSSGSGTRSSRQGLAPILHPWKQDSSQIDPCSRISRFVPAVRWRSSTFCVTTDQPDLSDHDASTSWARFGRHDASTSRRHPYQFQTSCGSRANAAAVARSSGRWERHSPSGPRKVGTPLAAETPAPVSEVTRPARRR
jgi:hypothetical protein